MLRQFAALCALFLITTLNLLAQSGPVEKFCGTTPEKVAWLKQYQLEPHTTGAQRGAVQYIPLSIHIVGNDEGVGYFDLHKLDAAICQLNEDYVQVGFQFYIKGDIDYINNSSWFSHQDFEPGYELLGQNKVPKSINCFTVADPAGNCGYSVYGQGIVLKMSCIQENSHTWAHEMGHAFSLPHTFSGWEGTTYQSLEQAPEYINGNEVERKDGTNCNSAGDGFCDTPSDYLSYRWTCNNDNFSTVSQKDPLANVFQSDGKYFMSYAMDQCESTFSAEQIEAIQSNLVQEKANLLNQKSPEVDIDQNVVTGLLPLTNSVDMPVNTTFSWDPVPYATSYIFQLSRFPNFAVSEVYQVTSAATVDVENLKSGKKYFWRVRARNAWSFCNPFTETHTLTVATLSATNDLIEQNWSVSPTLINSSNTIRVELPEASALKCRVYTLFGELIQTTDDSSNNSTTHDIQVQQWKPGVYFLEITASNVRKVFKVVVVS
ncbi:MAG: T9SS type A sorting domain-containing protein [Saprospiraceae bacterium]